MPIYSIYDYVDNLTNRSNKYLYSEILGVANKEGDIENKLQFINLLNGKYKNIEPYKVFDLYDELLNYIYKYKNKSKVIVIGLTDDSILMSQYIASRLKDCVYRLQVTKEKSSSREVFLKFNGESNSSLYIYASISKLPKFDSVLFIGDIIFSGVTILNCIKELNKIYSKVSYSLATIANFQVKETRNIFLEKSIIVYSILDGYIRDELKPLNLTKTPICTGLWYNDKIVIRKYVFENRLHIYEQEYQDSSIISIHKYIKWLYKEFKKTTLHNEIEETEEILILGTDELSFIPLLFAYMLGDKFKQKVSFQLLTSEALEPSSISNYTIKNRYTLGNFNSKVNYLYNLKKCDKVFFLVSKEIGDSLDFKLYNIFSNYGCKEINIIRISNNNIINEEVTIKCYLQPT